MMNVKVSKDKHISRWVDREVTSSLLDEIESKTMLKDEDRDQQRNQTMSEVKPVENIRKNLQSFLEISLEQKEVVPLNKLQDLLKEDNLSKRNCRTN